MSDKELRRFECADQTAMRQLARDVALLAFYVGVIAETLNQIRGGWIHGKDRLSAGPWLMMSDHAKCIEDRWRDETKDGRPGGARTPAGCG